MGIYHLYQNQYVYDSGGQQRIYNYAKERLVIYFDQELDQLMDDYFSNGEIVIIDFKVQPIEMEII
jgi:hypothetical protein